MRLFWWFVRKKKEKKKEKPNRQTNEIYENHKFVCMFR